MSNEGEPSGYGPGFVDPEVRCMLSCGETLPC